MEYELNLDGDRIMSADLVLPWKGRWTADLAVDAERSPGDDAVLRLLGRDYTGVVVSTGEIGGVGRMRIVGGTDGLSDVASSKHYRNAPSFGIILQDILDEVGERMSPTSSPDLLSQNFDRWTRIEAPAIDLVCALVGAVGAVWRVLPDGSIWAGNPEWIDASADFTLIEGSPESGHAVISAEVLEIDPGSVLEGMRIRSVRHRVTHATSRTTLVLDYASSHPLYEMVDRHLRIRHYDYCKPQPGKVESQDADGTLQIRLDDPRYPTLTGVPIRPGLPHTSLKIQSGARVLVEWEGSDPGAHVVTAWGSSSVQEITIGDSARKVAREQDTVDCGILTATVLVAGVPVPVQFTYTPPGGAPQAANPAATLQGKISSGSNILKVGG